jgi:ribulose-phosphate 3-epimerase
VVEALKRVTKLPLDCHLMIQKPERFAGAFVRAGAYSVSVHPEAAGDPSQALQDIRAAGGHPSLALKPATPVSAADPYAHLIDMLLIMTVNPGFSGQKIMLDCLPKYAEARVKFGPDLLLEIDGGVTTANAADVRAAGAQVLVAATAIFGSHDYPAAIRALHG